MTRNQKKTIGSSNAGSNHGNEPGLKIDSGKIKKTRKTAPRDSNSRRSSVYRGVTRFYTQSFFSLLCSSFVHLFSCLRCFFASRVVSTGTGIGGRDGTRRICGIRTAGMNLRTKKGSKVLELFSLYQKILCIIHIISGFWLELSCTNLSLPSKNLTISLLVFCWVHFWASPLGFDGNSLSW